jgi:hypothetical protein
MLPDWTILLIVSRENIINKCIFFNNLLYGQINKKSSTCVTNAPGGFTWEIHALQV